MRNEYEQFLKKVARDTGYDFNNLKKVAFMNPLSNQMFATALSGALKGLEMVSIATFDFKLTAIVKLLQAWLKEKREDLEKERIQTQYGADAWEEYKRNPSQFDDGYGFNSWNW